MRSALLALALLAAPAASAQAVAVNDLIAFGRVLTEDPYKGAAPYDVRVVSYLNPNDCLEDVSCRKDRLFIAVIGDGELPEYKVHDAGTAAGWKFLRWVRMPQQFHDDARDVFVIELEKTIACASGQCRDSKTRTEIVTAEVSLKGFRWAK